MMRDDEAAEAIRALTGEPVREVSALGGNARTATLGDGRTAFAKTSPPRMPTAPAAEAASLEWLRAADAVAVPEVLGHDERWLVTEHIAAGRPSVAAAEELGRGLARLHAAGAPAHGTAPPQGPAEAWIGLAPMRNEPCADWPEFYARHRIEPYVRLAREDGTFSSTEAAVFDEVCDRIAEFAGPAEAPSRLHGDLWNGNVHWAHDGRAWLLDPAAHGGHRETDLAMLELFGCPHLDHVLATYEQTHPLAAGWPDRVPLHQLFPLLTHTVLFGGSYPGQAVGAARQVLRTA